MKEMDADGSGEVSLAEFEAWWRSSVNVGAVRGRKPTGVVAGLFGGLATAGGLLRQIRKQDAVAARHAALARRRQLVVVGASGLRKVDVFGASDPYALLHWRGDDETIAKKKLCEDAANAPYACQRSTRSHAVSNSATALPLRESRDPYLG